LAAAHACCHDDESAGLGSESDDGAEAWPHPGGCRLADGGGDKDDEHAHSGEQPAGVLEGPAHEARGERGEQTENRERAERAGRGDQVTDPVAVGADPLRPMGRYHARFPGIDLRLAVAPGGSGTLADAVGEGTYDMAFVSLPGPPPAGVALRELASDSLTLVVAANHRLARRGRVPISELDEETFIDFPLGYGNRVVGDRAFAAAGLTRRVAVEITNIADGADYVRHGLGIALLPHFIIPERDDLARVAVTGADLNWPMSLATPTHRALSAAARALVAMIGNDD
jgi:DNA-binding transcriptional LysR family regulator